MRYAPQRTATIAYNISLLANTVVLVLLLADGRRARGRPPLKLPNEPNSIDPAPTPDPVLRARPVSAAVAALGAGVLSTAAFSPRIGAALLMLTAIFCLTGVSARRL